MQRKAILVAIAITLASALGFGQANVIFENPAAQQTVIVSSGDYVNLQFRGYLNQLQLNKSYVTAVSDSSLFLSSSDKSLPAGSFEIRGSDLTGFRRMPAIQPFIKPLGSLAATLGMFFVLESNSKFSAGEQILYTSLAGVAVNLLLDLLFPENIAHYVADGWRVRISR
jgi:hypothetical protein